VRFVIDIEPLRRFPQFRRLWFGYLVSLMGSQLTRVAVVYQVFTVTHSSLLVGLVSLVQLIPTLVGAMLGGWFADSMDRRRLLVIVNVAMMLASLGLTLCSVLNANIVAVFLLSAVTAGFNGVDSPTRTAVMMTTVDRGMIPKANALRQMLLQSSQVIGPAAAGLLLAAFGLTLVYAIDTASFAAAIVAVLMLRPAGVPGDPRQRGWSAIVDGFRFLRTRPAIGGCFIADLNATVFGMPTALFPALALDQFHGGVEALGYLNAAPGLGALVATLLAGWTPHVIRPGRAVLIATTVWGISITLFGLCPVLIPALLLLAMAGAADVLSAVFRGTIIQVEAPDKLRGRLSAIHTAVVQSGPRLGNTEAGLVAELAGTTASVVSGGIICVLGSFAIWRLMPPFAEYRLPIPQAEMAETASA
jgi:MFS family permease